MGAEDTTQLALLANACLVDDLSNKVLYLIFNAMVPFSSPTCLPKLYLVICFFHLG